MSITIDKVVHWRQLFKEQSWVQLDASIPLADAMKGAFPDVSHFKVMAMANIEEQRKSDAFVDLLKARMRHLEHKPLYMTMLVDALMDLHRFAEAVEALMELRAIYPDSPKLFEQMVHCAEQLGRDDLLEYAQGRFELSIGKELSKRFRFEDAVRYLKAANERNQADPRCGWLLGQALTMAGDYKSAAVCLSQQPAGTENQRDVILMQLEVALRTRNIATAKSIAEELLKENPAQIESLRALALVQEWTGDLLGAVATYHAIIKQYPFDVVASLKAIHIARHLVVSQVGNVVPFSDNQRITIACVLMDGGYEESGLEMLRAVKRSSNHYERARLLEIDHLIKHSHYENALKLLDSELKSAPESDEYLARAAQCHCLLGNYKRAEFLASKAADINYNNIDNLFWLAESQHLQCANGTVMTTEQLRWVISMYNSYAKHYPRDGYPLFRIANTHYIMKQYHLIKDCIDEARYRGYKNPRASYLMGKYWQDDGNLKEAIKEFTHAIELDATGKFYRAYYERAQTALMERNLPLAMQDARHLLSLWPDDKDALELMESVNAAARKRR